MGESIEFDRKAVQFEFINEYDRAEQYYLLVHQMGSTNVLNNDDSIAREWRFCAVGDKPSVITSLARSAGDIERGYLRYQNGETKTENFIKNWRHSMRDSNTISLTEFCDTFPFAEFVITKPARVTELSDADRNVFEHVTDTWRRTRPDTDDPPIYQHDISEQALDTFTKLSDHSSTWIDFK